MNMFVGMIESKMSNNRIYLRKPWREEFNEKCYCRIASYESQSNGKINVILAFRTKVDMEEFDSLGTDYTGFCEYLPDTFEAEISCDYITIPKKYRELCRLENGKIFLQLGFGEYICFAIDKKKVNEEEMNNLLTLLMKS